uniref:Neuroendocrine protein 7B2 n=1 Tax=Dendroctonus ponderosae TaxID=77166 RepID=J3JX96_DENPD|nr:unknown [Dendroctonus ponderosae]
MKSIIFVLVLPFTSILAYLPSEQEGLLPGVVLRDISKYLELNDGLPLDTRALSRNEDGQLFPLDYENLGDVNMYPSIRDQEYLQQTSLWGNQYISGGAGDGNQILTPGIKTTKQEIKTDASLPAYCNPPNPCPVGYNEDQGCLSDFENTSSFSRDYQLLQDCMCDTEHMFDCPRATKPLVDEFCNLLRSFEKMKTNPNPFLAGEKLPVAAKKGNNMY